MSDEGYPTVWAYEQACKALERTKQELAEAREELEVERTTNDGLVDLLGEAREEIARLKVRLRQQEDRFKAKGNVPIAPREGQA